MSDSFFFQQGPDSLVTKWQIISSRIIGWGQMQMQITTGYEIPMPHQRLIIEKNRKMSKVLNRNSSHKAFKICRRWLIVSWWLILSGLWKVWESIFFDTVFLWITNMRGSSDATCGESHSEELFSSEYIFDTNLFCNFRFELYVTLSAILWSELAATSVTIRANQL